MEQSARHPTHPGVEIEFSVVSPIHDSAKDFISPSEIPPSIDSTDRATTIDQASEGSRNQPTAESPAGNSDSENWLGLVLKDEAHGDTASSTPSFVLKRFPFERSNFTTPSLASLFLRVDIPASCGDRELRDWLDFMGEALVKMQGFRSRKVLVSESSAADHGRVMIILLKWERFEDMMAWTNSEVLIVGMQKASDLGLSVNRVLSRDSFQRINLTVLAGFKISPNGESPPIKPPPKWKFFVLICAMVTILVVLHDLAGTLPALMAIFGGDFAFSMLILFILIVPLITYCCMPLLLSFPAMKRWVFVRTLPVSKCEPMRSLDQGLGIFTPLPAPDFSRQVGLLEKKLENLQAVAARQSYEIAKLRKELNIQARSEHAEPVGPVAKAANEEATAALRSRIRKEHDFHLNTQYNDSDNLLTGGHHHGEVTCLAKHTVRLDCIAEFESWCMDMSDTMHRFLGNDFHGLDVFNRSYPLGAGGTSKDAWIGIGKIESEFVVLFRVASREAMTNWLSSNERFEHLETVMPLVEAATTYAEAGKEEALAGAGSIARAEDIFEHFLQGDSAGVKQDSSQAAPPPLYRTTTLATLGLFLVAWPLNAKLQPKLVAGGVPFPIDVLITVTLNTFNNTYVGAAFMQFLFGGWLRMPGPENPKGLIRILSSGLTSNLHRLAVIVVYIAILFIAAFFNRTV